MINTPNNLSYSWHMVKSSNIQTTTMCALGLNRVAIKRHLECLYSFTHANFLKGHNMEDIYEIGNIIP